MSEGETEAADAITPDEFNVLMTALGPFECAPVVAIACSGGPDSMALALLTADWAATSGGRAVALIVDHGLRSESAAEAQSVQARLKAQNIASEILTREGGQITGDIQAQARNARYSLMTQWCGRHHILHLLFAHHREDQAETVLLRLERGSSVYGMSGMARVRETGQVRILRPFLGVSRSRLRSTVCARNVTFVEDPSNQDTRFARVRVRRRLEGMEGAVSIQRLSQTASQMGAARNVLEDASGAALARFCQIFPEGYCLLDWAGLASTHVEIRRRVLAAIVTCIGGRSYTPRFKRICNLESAIRAGRIGGGRTLSGCRIAPRRNDLLICRDPAVTQGPVMLSDGLNGAHVLWDGRYRLQVQNAPEGAVVAKLGGISLAKIGPGVRNARNLKRPAVVRHGFPTLWRDNELLASPFLGYVNPAFAKGGGKVEKIDFLPENPLTRARFTFA